MFIVKLFLTEKSENDMAPLGDNGINKFIYRIYIILKLRIIDFFFTNVNMNTFQKTVPVNIRSYLFSCIGS